MGREHAISIFTAAVAAVQPAVLMKKNVQQHGDTIWIAGQTYHLPPGRPVWIFGAGKASAAMALALEEILTGIPLQGLVITKYHHSLPLQHITLAEAAHPVPDENGVQATRQLISLLKQVEPNDLVIFLLSGGASALLADYPDGTSLAQVQTVFELLLKSGATIQEMNTIRKHLSVIKGGQLALLANTTAFCSLILSDVVGDDLHVIGSGPTVPDPSTFADAAAIIQKYNLQLPEPIQQHLKGNIPDTPKPGHPRFDTIRNLLVGNNKIALDAAADKATALGYEVHILTTTATGEAAELAKQLVHQAINWQGKRPACLLLGGETTVTITGNGLGGRNQQFALAAAIALQNNHQNITILSAGTDGTDGPTDAAGAIADAAVITCAGEKKLDAEQFLQQNDAYHFFEQTAGLLKTGATQTNVMDIIVVIINY